MWAVFFSEILVIDLTSVSHLSFHCFTSSSDLLSLLMLNKANHLECTHSDTEEGGRARNGFSEHRVYSLSLWFFLDTAQLKESVLERAFS